MVYLEQPSIVYIQALQRALDFADIGTGLLKCVAFAVATGLVACQRGLSTRGGAAGVLVVSCPPRDCWHREGPAWLHERIYNGRDAELQERVDRRNSASTGWQGKRPSVKMNSSMKLSGDSLESQVE